MTELASLSAAICADYKAISDPADEEANRALRNFNLPRAARISEESLGAIQDGYEQLSLLPKPKGDAEVLTELDDLRNQVAVLEERAIDAEAADDVARVESLVDELNVVVQRKNDLETGYGFDVCGQN